MTRVDFLKGLDEILELAPGTLTGPEKLDDYPLWDSTAIISFLALADSHDSRRIPPREVGNCETVEDLLRLAKVDP